MYVYAHGKFIQEGALGETNTYRWDNIIHIILQEQCIYGNEL